MKPIDLSNMRVVDLSQNWDMYTPGFATYECSTSVSGSVASPGSLMAAKRRSVAWWRLPRAPAPFGVTLTKLERGSKGRRPLGRVRGIPEKPLFLFLLAAAGGERGKKKLEDTPNPGRGLPAPLKLTPKGVPLPYYGGCAPVTSSEATRLMPVQPAGLLHEGT